METSTKFVTDDSKSFANRSAQIAFAVASYWMISISMVFLNKTVLSSPATKLDAPLFITWYQCVCTVVACYALGELGLGDIPRFELKQVTMWKLLPLSVVFVAMIATNNICLKYVEVSFYQVARSLTIVFNVILDFAILGQPTSKSAVACLVIVIFGFVLGNEQEVRWSLPGVLFGVFSSFFVALNAIFVKKNLAYVDNNPWKLTLYNNANAAILFLPLILVFGEVSVIARSENIFKLAFWTLMTIGGVLGVAISFAAAAQIKWTSPLTHNVSGTAKAAAQTVLALLIYRNPVTLLGFISVLIVLGGSLCYTLVRRSEMRSKFEHEDTGRAPGVRNETKGSSIGR